MPDRIQRHTDLEVYQLAFNAAIQIFKLSKKFPKEEKYSLTDQIRRSSRSVCANIAEAWRKRRYRAAFINKLNNAEAEATETQVWLDFCYNCQYLEEDTVIALRKTYDFIIGKLVMMIRSPEKWSI
jgi:four helix bundle protein